MYKIAIADDDMDVPTSLGNYFPWEDNGFEVVAKLFDGRQALEFLDCHEVDVLISDICMPVMSGIDLVRELRARGRKVQVVLLSAYKDFQYAQAAMSYGVRHYIVKPATYSEILDVLKKVKEELRMAERPQAQQTPGHVSAFNAKIVSQIKTYVDQHCDTATLASVAQLVHMNTSYLSRFFKENAGENLSAYLTRVRMDNALRMLQDVTQKNIYEIGEKLGYANSKSFTKAFKAYYGITPQEYRKSFQSCG